MIANPELRSVAIVPRDDSAESLFPFDFALIDRPEVNVQHVVSDINTLMGSLLVVVGKPFAVDVIKVIQAEVNKVIQALPFCLTDITFTVRICHRSTHGRLFWFHALAPPKRVKPWCKLSVPITNQKSSSDSNIFQPHSCISGLLKHPRIVRMKSWWTHKNLPASQVNKHQDVSINLTSPCKNRFREESRV